jgi:FtsP/CotA-like multicopper oxidase with cupredoxin domain
MNSGITRRQSIQLGATGVATGLFTSGQVVSLATSGDLPAGPTTTPFVDNLVVHAPKSPVSSLNPPSTATAQTATGECGRNDHQRRDQWPANKFYEMRVRAFDHKFHRDLPAQKLWGFDSMFPGPTFVERYGEPTIVRIHNNLPSASQHVGFGSPEISTHLHNLHTGSESDGFTTDYYSATVSGPTLKPGSVGSFKDNHYPHFYAGYDDPRYRATSGDPREALGTLWYHDHREGFTAPNCYRGLMGMYLLFDHIDSGNEVDTNPAALRLPSGVGDFDIPLMVTDFMMDSSGNVQFDQFENKGILGNKISVNGKIAPKFSVKTRKYRFRLLAASLSRFYEFYLTDGAGVNQPFSYISNDGNLLPAPIETTRVLLSPAQRADIVIDFKKFPVGTKLYLVNRLIQTDGRGPEDDGTNARDAKGDLRAKGTQLLRFDIDTAAQSDPSQVPPKLRELPPIDLGEVVRTRNFRFDKQNEVWTVNGKIFDFEKPTITVKKNTAEIWELEGNGSWHHPVHIHMEEFRILSRNGRPPPPHEIGRKDVVVLAPGEKVRLFFRFRDLTGKYMMHCHNLIHEDHAMMIRFDIVE